MPTHSRTPTPSNSVFESELSDHIPVVKTSIAGTRLVGRMTAGRWCFDDELLYVWASCTYVSACTGNRNGLLVPNSTTDQGMMVRMMLDTTL